MLLAAEVNCLLFAEFMRLMKSCFAPKVIIDRSTITLLLLMHPAPACITAAA